MCQMRPRRIRQPTRASLGEEWLHVLMPRVVLVYVCAVCSPPALWLRFPLLHSS